MPIRRPVLFLAALALPAGVEPLVRQTPALTEAGVQLLLREAERLAQDAKDPAAAALGARDLAGP